MAKKPPLTLVTDAEPDGTGLSPPATLGKAGKVLWRKIQSEYGIGDAGGLVLLNLACEAADRAASLKAVILRDGEVISGRSGLRAHPALREEGNCRMFIARTLARLGCLDEPLKAVGRPSHALGWQGFYGRE
jgi:hypothetical protein